MLSSSRWLSKVSPQAHRIMLFGCCDGKRSPASHQGILSACSLAVNRRSQSAADLWR
jgi:hypothetical protein